jgi:hypothetical protein
MQTAKKREKSFFSSNVLPNLGRSKEELDGGLGGLADAP